MRKLFLWFFLISNIGFCQIFDSTGNLESSAEFFEDKGEKDQQTEEKSLSEVIFGIEKDDDESAFFYTDDEEYDEPEQGEDAANPADPVPINGWLLILPIAASIIAFKFLYNPKNRKTVNKG